MHEKVLLELSCEYISILDSNFNFDFSSSEFYISYMILFILQVSYFTHAKCYVLFYKFLIAGFSF